MIQPERTPVPAPTDERARRLVRLKHANTVLSEISKVGTRQWAAEDGTLSRLQVTVDAGPPGHS